MAVRQSQTAVLGQKKTKTEKPAPKAQQKPKKAKK